MDEELLKTFADADYDCPEMASFIKEWKDRDSENRAAICIFVDRAKWKENKGSSLFIGDTDTIPTLWAGFFSLFNMCPEMLDLFKDTIDAYEEEKNTAKDIDL